MILICIVLAAIISVELDAQRLLLAMCLQIYFDIFGRRSFPVLLNLFILILHLKKTQPGRLTVSSVCNNTAHGFNIVSGLQAFFFH